MRNIADIIKDDRNGKQLSQTERQISVAYIQGKYDAAMELKTNVNGVLDKIRAEIEQNAYPIVHGINNHEKGMTLYGILQVIDKYKKMEVKK